MSGASCCGTDFFKTALESADVRGALAHFAYFCRADLTGARFDGSLLFHASFSGATCLRTSFVGADLRGTDLSDALLSAADFRRARLWGANFAGASLSADTRLAGALGLESVIADVIQFEGEEIRGDSAKNLLVKLGEQQETPADDTEI